MTVRDLNRKQLMQLKQTYLTCLPVVELEKIIDSDVITWGVMAAADDYVSDEVIFDYYDGYNFVEDDFYK